MSANMGAFTREQLEAQIAGYRRDRAATYRLPRDTTIDLRDAMDKFFNNDPSMPWDRFRNVLIMFYDDVANECIRHGDDGADTWGIE